MHSAVGSPAERSAAGGGIPIPQAPENRTINIDPKRELPSRSFTGPPPSISIVALLAILGVVVAWLFMVLRWRSGSTLEIQHRTLTLFQFEAVDSRMERILRLLSLALFILAGLFGALESRRPRLPRGVAFLFFIMMAYCAFWCLISLQESSEFLSLFLSSTSPFMFAMCLGVFAGFDETLWPRLRLVALGIAHVSGALAVYYTSRLTIKGHVTGFNPAIAHLQITFWFGLCALVLHKSSRWRDCLPALIPVALCIPLAIIACNRSFTLLSVVALMAGLLIPIRRHFQLLSIRLVALGLCSAAILGAGLLMLSMAAPERVEDMNNRLFEDTRSAQYEQFFEQVPLKGLILGLGPKATYTFGERIEYDYIDNQFLFILFKFGLPVLIGYFAVVLWPGIWLLVKAQDPGQRMLGIVFLFWTLAALGVSIFQDITPNAHNFMIILLAGRAFARMSERRRALFPPLGSLCPVYSRKAGVDPRRSAMPKT